MNDPYGPSNTVQLPGGQIAYRYRILLSHFVVHTIYEPTILALEAPQGTRHGTITTIDGRCMGRLVTRDLPPEIQALPVGEGRFTACREFRTKLQAESSDLLLQAFPYLTWQTVTWTDGDAEVHSLNLAATVEFLASGRELEHFSWHATAMSNPRKRYRLFNLGKETRYFVDRDRHPADHSRPYTVLGSGMHPSGCAATFGSFAHLDQAQADAERRWRDDQRAAARTIPTQEDSPPCSTSTPSSPTP